MGVEAVTIDLSRSNPGIGVPPGAASFLNKIESPILTIPVVGRTRFPLVVV
jgi:hypothetical protein